MVVKLSLAQVNSWRLSKHHIAQRASKDQMAQVVSEVCGVQAQVMSGAALAIWARTENTTVRDVEDALWKHRSLVKTWCMRGTLHLLAASDLPLYVAALKTRVAYKNKSWLKFYRLRQGEIESIISAVPKALDGKSLTREELVNSVAKIANLRPRVRREMLSGWGSLLHPAAYHGYLCFGPSQGQNVTFVRPDQWLREWDEPTGEDALKILLRRFLATYGPATHDDFAHWWGTQPSKTRPIMKSIADELEEVEFEGHRAWMDKGDVEEIQKTPPSLSVGSVHLLPSFDCYVMFYHPRESFVSQKFRPRVFRQLAGWNSPVLLLDGLAGGVWELKRTKDQVETRVQPFHALTSVQKRLVEKEAARLEEFAATRTLVSFSK